MEFAVTASIKSLLMNEPICEEKLFMNLVEVDHYGINWSFCFLSFSLGEAWTDLHWNQNFFLCECGEYETQKAGAAVLLLFKVAFSQYVSCADVKGASKFFVDNKKQVIWDGGEEKITQAKQGLLFPSLLMTILDCHLFHDFSFFSCWIFNAVTQWKTSQLFFYLWHFT